ncbi:hypothetical protein HJC23_005978 [Cyclotella cryptica]|uniref:HSF-type DNA-binding domain-containing protein n=1 Tax=Cyclotella cryptica TaxID=29204 RepID=A0ABD3NTV8_9STRA|eukprot:CCRYP_019957-RB/>CCRYP_019957-RB protein AED:0.11 eAED:0.11 QI:428/1/1/1/0.5/0.33/3/219/652
MSELDDDNESASAPTPPPRKKRVVKATLIDHTYIDYSKYQITDTNVFKKGHGSTDHFPRKLHCILSRPEYHHIISWMPHGRAWKIWNKELLVSVVCKEQFKHEKFESFNRQVNGWGFKRLFRNGPDFKCYYNQFFLRGLPELTSHMHRLDKPGKRLPNKLEEPDLYEISRRFPLPELNASGVPEATRENESSMLLDSNSLTVPQAHSSYRELRPAQTFRFDCNERVSTHDSVPSSDLALPKVVSRGSAENKASRLWQTWHNEVSPPTQEDQLTRQETKISKAKDNPFRSKTPQLGRASSSSTGYGETFERYGRTQDSYCNNEVYDVKKSRFTKYQQEHTSPFQGTESQPINGEITLFPSHNHDNKVKHHQAGTVNSHSSYPTEHWDHHPLHGHHEDQGQAQQQEWQHYYDDHTQGHAVSSHSMSVEHKGDSVSMHYAGSKPHFDRIQYNCQVQHCNEQYSAWYQGHSVKYNDPMEYHHYKSTMHYTPPSLGLENNARGSEEGNYPFSSKSQYPHQVQLKYKDHYPSHQMHGTKNTCSHFITHNDPFVPKGYNSYEINARSTHAWENSQHHHEGIDTQDQLQPKYAQDKTSKSRSQSHKNQGSKLSALDKSSQSYNPSSTSPHSHHSLSPLSSLMDSFLDFEPSPSMFDEKSK